jgi:hypothetical protein
MTNQSTHVAASRRQNPALTRLCPVTAWEIIRAPTTILKPATAGKNGTNLQTFLMPIPLFPKGARGRFNVQALTQRLP